MTLSGNLDFVPLDEVLRLLTRAGSDGAVEITSGDISGRVFVSGGGIALATTMGDHSFRDHLLSSGYVSEEELAAIESGQTPMSTFDDNGSELVALVREMTIESIYQMETLGSDFQVVKDAVSPYAAPIPFDLETVIRDSRARAEQWVEVSKVISDLGATLTINRDLEPETVELDREAWRLLSEIGPGASAHELAGRLGTTEFAVARVASAMAQRNLLQAPSSDSGDSTAEYDFDAVAEAAASSATVSDPQESWWEEPEVPVPAETPSEPPAAEVPVAQEPVTAEPGDHAQPMTSPAAESRPEEPAAPGEEGDDAEAFLEKVFSELGPTEEEEPEGHGLMRRRRMGSILRELGED